MRAERVFDIKLFEDFADGLSNSRHETGLSPVAEIRAGSDRPVAVVEDFDTGKAGDLSKGRLEVELCRFGLKVAGWD